MGNFTGKLTTILGKGKINMEKYIFDSIRSEIINNYGTEYLKVAKVIYLGTGKELDSDYDFGTNLLEFETVNGYGHMLPRYFDNFLQAVNMLLEEGIYKKLVYIIIDTTVLENTENVSTAEKLGRIKELCKLFNDLLKLSRESKHDISLFTYIKIHEAKNIFSTYEGSYTFLPRKESIKSGLSPICLSSYILRIDNENGVYIMKLIKTKDTDLKYCEPMVEYFVDEPNSSFSNTIDAIIRASILLREKSLSETDE